MTAAQSHTMPYGSILFNSLPGSDNFVETAQQPLADWASSGLMFLIGNGQRPVLTDNTVPTCANQTLEAIRQVSGKPILQGIQGSQLLCERAACIGFTPNSQSSCNGSCHLIPCANKQFIAINLARESDWHSLPALLQTSSENFSLEDLKEQLRNKNAEQIVQQGRLLGLAIAAAPLNCSNKPWFSIAAEGKTATPAKPPLVLDLSSLWAGPLCSHLLQLCGARVIKVESQQRPDGAGLNQNAGGKQFFDLLNSNKDRKQINFQTKAGLAQLQQLIEQADIVIEGSRPRALHQLNIFPEKIVKQRAGLIWISITGYGRKEPENNWIAFGDDAAIAAGLFHKIDNEPVFVGDAIADPLTGLHAALAALAFWRTGKSVLLDINLQAVAAFCNHYATIDDNYTITEQNQKWLLETNDRQYLIQKPKARLTSPCC